MQPNQFAYHEAGDVEEAIDLLQTHGDGAAVIAGGHSLVPDMKAGDASPETVIDVGDIDRLHGIEHDGSSSRLGSMTTYSTVVDDDTLTERTVLAETASQIGDSRIRNRGTVGGNLAQANPRSDLPGAMLASDATIHTHGPDGTAAVPASSFFEGAYETTLGASELVVDIEVPHLGPDDSAVYLKKRKPTSGYALVGIAAVLDVDDGAVTDARVAANGVFETARRLDAAEEIVSGVSLADVDPSRAGTATTEAVDTDDVLSDLDASSEFRAHLLSVYVERAVETAVDRAGATVAASDD
jgi:carbon-monoxide dehydrogenase medium subunit